MIAADECVTVELTFAEQRALVWATTLKRAETRGRANDDEIDAACRNGEWTVAGQITRASGAPPRRLCRELR
jgi:hypothetical protein